MAPMHIPALVSLLLPRPLISLPVAAEALECSCRGAKKMLMTLAPALREVTGRERCRA
jgi:hypothetical protein